MPNQKNKPVVLLKMLKNRLTMLTNEKNEFLSPPHRQKEKFVDHLREPAMVSAFDMEFVHKVPVPDLTVRTPKKQANMPQAFYAKLVEASYVRNLTARADADELRKLIQHYISSGVYELVADESHFMDVTEEFDEAELDMIESKREAAAAEEKRAFGK